MEALTRDSRRLSTTSMNTKRTFLLCRKADISTWGLQAFLRRLNRSEATGENENTNVRLVDPAQAPRKPISNKATTLVILAAMLGFAISSFVAVIREWFDASIFRSSDVESKLGSVCIAQVPYIGDSTQNEGAIYGYLIPITSISLFLTSQKVSGVFDPV